MFKTLIKNAKIVDGSGSETYTRDIAIMHGISAITKDTAARIVVAGSRKQSDVFSAMRPMYPQFAITLAEASPAEPFSVSGMISLAENSCSGN